MYRLTKQVDAEKEKLKQSLVPKVLRKEVMKIAHDSMLTEHMDFKKMEDRILTNFFQPGIHRDVARFCRSCDLCQRTVSKGSLAELLSYEIDS